MSKKSEMAVKNFESGYNCAQSVMLAFSDELGLEKDFALKLASSFGGGMGRLREVCGAVSVMFMIAGIVNGYLEPNNDIVKQEHYKFIQDLAEKFKQKYGTIICRELLGEEGNDTSYVPSKRTEEYYAKRPCAKFIGTAAEIIEKEILKEQKDEC